MTEITQVDLGIRVTEVWGKACNLKGEYQEESFYSESPQGGQYILILPKRETLEEELICITRLLF